MPDAVAVAAHTFAMGGETWAAIVAAFVASVSAAVAIWQARAAAQQARSAQEQLDIARQQLTEMKDQRLQDAVRDERAAAAAFLVSATTLSHRIYDSLRTSRGFSPLSPADSTELPQLHAETAAALCRARAQIVDRKLEFAMLHLYKNVELLYQFWLTRRHGTANPSISPMLDLWMSRGGDSAWDMVEHHHCTPLRSIDELGVGLRPAAMFRMVTNASNHLQSHLGAPTITEIENVEVLLPAEAADVEARLKELRHVEARLTERRNAE